MFEHVIIISSKCRTVNYPRLSRVLPVVKKPQGECGRERPYRKYVIDSLSQMRYNYSMKTRRTPRKDCNYIIYAMTSEKGDSYIGLTRKSLPNADKVVAERWRKHKSRAVNENRMWNLYVYLKSGGLAMNWRHEIIAVIRGRAEAYAYERELVKLIKPELNDQYL
jgi:hypothetical protein